jgi:iron complex outermembrane receptor protein
MKHSQAFGCLLAIAMAAPAYSAARAQEANPPATQDEVGLQDIVVTAQKRAQSLQDVPISVSVLEGAALTKANITDTKSLGQLAPSLTFSQGFGPVAVSFNIRGAASFVSELGVQPAVSVVVDGVPLARNAEFVGQLGELERLEVLNGPQGTLFGRNSTGGAINVVRQGPSDTFGGNIDASLSAGKEGGVEILTKFGITGALAQGVRGRLSGYMLDRSNYVKNLAIGGEDHGKENSWGLVGKLAFDLGENAELLLTGEGKRYRSQASQNNVLAPLVQAQQPNVPNVTAQQIALLTPAAIGDLFTINQNGNSRSTIDLWGVTADLSWNLTDELRLKSITSYRDVRVRTQPDSDSSPANPTNTFGWLVAEIPFNGYTNKDPRRIVDWHYLTQELRLEYSSDSFDIVGGAFYQNYKEDLENAVPFLLSAQGLGGASAASVGTPTGPSVAFPYYYSDAIITPSDRNKTLAGFIDVTFHATDSLDLFAGYRLSHEKLSFDYARTSYFFPVRIGVNYDPQTFTPTIPGTSVAFGASSSDNNWSGRVGARYEISKQFSVYGTASRGYIGAGADLSRATGGTVANPAAAFLRPSTARNFEVGFKSQFLDRRVRLNGAIFDLLVKDLQAQSIIPGTVNSRVQNAGDIRSRGAELTVDALVTSHFSINGGASYIDSKFRNFQFGCYVGQSAADGCVGGTQSIDGKQGINTPKFKYNIGAEYRAPINDSVELYINPRFNWQGKVFYTLDHDPFNTQKSYGLLDLTLGVTAGEGRYDLSVFAKNITNKHFCQSKQTATIIGRSFCQGTSYDAQRLIGIAGRVKF